MPVTYKWADIKHRSFFPWLWRRMKMRGRRIRSRIALGIFYRIWPMIVGHDVLKTPYGRLIERIVPHRTIDEYNPVDILNRIIREREQFAHTLQRQQELIARQQETISILVPASIDRLTAEVSTFADKLEAKLDDRPTSWERLDDDAL